MKPNVYLLQNKHFYLLPFVIFFWMITGWTQKPTDWATNVKPDIMKIILKRSSYNQTDNPGFITKAKAIADLDELQARINNTHSYIFCHDFDYKMAISEMKNSLEDSVPIYRYGIMIHKFIKNLGDGHAKVEAFENYLAKGFSPVKYGIAKNRIFAYKVDAPSLLDNDFPFVKAIDNVAADVWFSMAADITSGRNATTSDRINFGRNTMEYVRFMRTELGIQQSDSVTYTLESSDGTNTKQVILPLKNVKTKTIRAAFNLPNQSKILKDNIGYVRLYSHQDDNLTNTLDSIMEKFRDTKALILDSRQSGGGTRRNLETLFPYFMTEADSIYIPNITRLRIPENNDKFNPKGNLNAGDKKLKYIDDDDVTENERRALSKLLSSFQPKCNVPDEKVTSWYFMAIHSDKHKYFYKNPIYVLIDFGVGSAGDIFASTLKGWRNVTLVGTPTNGRSGNSKTISLKNSGIAVSLSTMVSYQKDGSLFDWVGVEPDILLEPNIEDWFGQTDTILGSVVERINKR